MTVAVLFGGLAPRGAPLYVSWVFFVCRFPGISAACGRLEELLGYA